MLFEKQLSASAILTLILLHLAHRVYLRITRTKRLCRYFAGRHVWVVGASQGLGAAMCKRLHQLGAQLTISSRSEERLAKVAAQCGDCSMHPLDVSGGSDAVRRAWMAVNRAKSVDSVVFNAGINHRGEQFTRINATQIDAVIDTNLRGAAHVLHAALGAQGGMKEGNVCVVSSLAAYRGVPGASVYGATKAALSALATAINVELIARGERRLRVIAVHPGFIDTPAIRGLDHPKPLLLSEQAAADLVLDAVACGQRHYGFPWLMEHVVARVQLVLPSPLYEHVLSIG